MQPVTTSVIDANANARAPEADHKVRDERADRAATVAAAALAAAPQIDAKIGAAGTIPESQRKQILEHFSKLASLLTNCPVKIDNLQHLPLGQAIDILVVTLLVNMTELARPEMRNPIFFEEVLVTIGDRDWKTIKPGILLKLFHTLAGKLELDSAVVKDIQQQVVRIQLLTGLKDCLDLPINPVKPDKATAKLLINFSGVLVHKVSDLIFPAFRYVYNKLTVFFQEGAHLGSNCTGNWNDGLRLEDRKALFGEFTLLLKRLQKYTSVNANIFQQACRQPIGRVEFSQEQVMRIAELSQKASFGFSKPLQAAQDAFLGFEKWMAITRGTSYSPASKDFVAQIHKEFQSEVVRFYESISTQLPAEMQWPELSEDENRAIASDFMQFLGLVLKQPKDLEQEAKGRSADQDRQMLAALDKWKAKSLDPKFADTFRAECEKAAALLWRNCFQIIKARGDVCKVLFGRRGITSSFYTFLDTLDDFIQHSWKMLLDNPETFKCKMEKGYFLAALNWVKGKAEYDRVNRIDNFLEVLFQRSTDFLKTQTCKCGSPNCTEGNIAVMDANVQTRMREVRSAAEVVHNLSLIISLPGRIFSPIIMQLKPFTVEVQSAEASEEAWCALIDELDNEELEEYAQPKDSCCSTKKCSHRHATRKHNAHADPIEKPEVSLALQAIQSKKVVKVAYPYPDQYDRVLALLRHRLSGLHQMPAHVITPLSVLGKNPPAHVVAVQQQFFMLDCLQSVSEMLHQSKQSANQKLLRYFFRVYENLVVEQGLTAACVTKRPEMELTHRIDHLFEMMQLKASAYVAGQYTKGTIPERYPFSVSLQYRPESEMKVAMDTRIAEFADISAAAFSGEKTITSVVLLKDVEASSKAAQVESAEAEVKELNQRALLRALEVLDRSIKTANGSNELQNMRYHLTNLMQVMKLIEEYPAIRFLNAQAHMALISVQYFIENLGVYLSKLKDAEMHTHSFKAYCEAFQLGEGLPEQMLTLLHELDVRKGSEYLFRYFGIRKKEQISPVMLFQSGVYASSVIARRAYEIGEPVKRSEVRDTCDQFTRQLKKWISLVEGLTTLHLSAK